MFSTDPLFDNFAVSIGLGLGGQPGEILAICALGLPTVMTAVGTTPGRRPLTGSPRKSINHAATATAADCPRPLCEPASTTQSHTTLFFDAPVDRGYSAPSSGSPRHSSKLLRSSTLREALEIPYGGHRPPGWFFRADTDELPRPLLIATNGYDATLYEMRGCCLYSVAGTASSSTDPVKVEPYSRRAWSSGRTGRTWYPPSSMSPCNDPMSIPTGSP
jgi:hypothetical protein